MKNNRNLFKTLLLLCFGLFIAFTTSAQEKKLADSGKKPGWVNWGRGKDFKHLGKGRANKLKLDKNDDVYLFVVYARETANNGKTDLFSLDDAKRVASLNASFEMATILKQSMDATIANSAKITDDERQRLFERTEKMKTAAKFSGFTRVGSYWEKIQDKDSGKTYWDVYYLYSINQKALQENLEKAMTQLGIPDEAPNVMTRIQTVGDDADDEDLDIGEF